MHPLLMVTCAWPAKVGAGPALFPRDPSLPAPGGIVSVIPEPAGRQGYREWRGCNGGPRVTYDLSLVIRSVPEFSP